MAGIRASAAASIGRPATTVYGFITEGFFHNYPRWSPEVVELRATTAGPLRLGSSGVQVRVDQGRRSETRFRVIDLKAPERIVFQGTPNPFRIAYELRPESEALTQLSFSFELQRLDLFMRPFEKLIRMAIRQGVRDVPYRIKSLVEAETRFPAEPAAQPGSR